MAENGNTHFTKKRNIARLLEEDPRRRELVYARLMQDTGITTPPKAIYPTCKGLSLNAATFVILLEKPGDIENLYRLLETMLKY